MLSEEFVWRGRTVRWERIGTGPAVVLWHGTPWSSDLWRPIADALAPYFTVYLWDMPGYGQSFLVADHYEVFAALTPGVHEGALRAYIGGASHAGLGPRELDRLAEPWLGDEGQAAFYRQIAEADEVYTDEIEPMYPQIDVPVLVVWGREDAWIPVDRAQRLTELIPGARLRIVDQAGHLIQLDRPAALTAALSQWLAAG